GMLVGAGLSRVWSHDRTHKFFSVARWSTQQLSTLLAALVVRLLVAADATVEVIIDDTLFTPASSPRPAHPNRNPHHPPGLGRPGRITAKLEWSGRPTQVANSRSSSGTRRARASTSSVSRTIGSCRVFCGAARRAACSASSAAVRSPYII